MFFEVNVSDWFDWSVSIDEEKKNDNSIVAGNEPEGNKRREKKSLNTVRSFELDDNSHLHTHTQRNNDDINEN